MTLNGGTPLKKRLTFAAGLVREWRGLFARWYTNEQGRQCYQSPSPFGIGLCQIVFVEGGGTKKRRLATIQGHGVSEKSGPWAPFFPKVQQLSGLIQSSEEREAVHIQYWDVNWGVGKMLKPVISFRTLNGVYLASNQVYLNICYLFAPSYECIDPKRSPQNATWFDFTTIRGILGS